MEKFLRFLSGYVKIRVQGEQGERFLNLCRSRGVDMRQLSRREDGRLVCYLSVRHFFLLSSISSRSCFLFFPAASGTSTLKGMSKTALRRSWNFWRNRACAMGSGSPG